MPLHVRMSARDPGEEHRAATPLELFFDLTLVVAVAQAGSSLHHGLVDGGAGDALLGFPLVFFAIWWAWVNFTWFASAYDTDDALYRVMVLVQMTGVLIVAAGVPRAFEDREFGTMVLGYVVMRLALVSQWLRVAHSHPEGRAPALRFAAGLALVQVAWVAWMAAPDGLFLPGFLLLAVADCAVPVWAEAAGRTSWHPGHIVERYGLFTIIVLGESVLAATIGVQAALDADSSPGDLAAVVAGGLLIVFSLWWIYFDLPTHDVLGRARRVFDERLRGAFAWSYGHYVVFASVAAVGAGLAVAVDHAAGHSELTDIQAGLAVTLPVSAYLLAVWAINYRHKRPGTLRSFGVPVATALIVAATVTPEPVLATGLVLATLLTLHLVTPAGAPSEP